MKFKDWIINQAIPWFTSLGITTRTVTLETRGRHSGKRIRVSLSRTDCKRFSYLVSLTGESQWVRNVRANNGHATIIFGRRRAVKLIEIPIEERADVLLAYVQERAFLHSREQLAQIFFGLNRRPTLADMEGMAYRYPVFKIIDD